MIVLVFSCYCELNVCLKLYICNCDSVYMYDFEILYS